MNHLFDLVTVGTFSASLKAFFFFFSLPDMTEKEKKEIDLKVEQNMSKFNNTYNQSIVRNTLKWLEYDMFSSELKRDFEGQYFINELIGLKTSYINFYQIYLDEISKTDEKLNQVADLVAKNDEYILQIARFRMIVDPQIQLSQNIHKQTKILYMKVKGYWLNDEGVKERKFFKSLGRFDLYPNGVKDDNAIIDGRKKIREAMLVEYSNIYKR
jgi:hypothetical protein